MVVQEVFAEGLAAQDGRLRLGDQLIEINGIDMTNATHHQVIIINIIINIIVFTCIRKLEISVWATKWR